MDYTQLTKEQLYEIKQQIDNELNKRCTKKEEEFIKNNHHYLGKYFKRGDNEYIKTINFCTNNVHRIVCLCLDLGPDDYVLYYDDLGLLCNDYTSIVHTKVIDTYIEITKEEFKKVLLDVIEKVI